MFISFSVDFLYFLTSNEHGGKLSISTASTSVGDSEYGSASPNYVENDVLGSLNFAEMSNITDLSTPVTPQRSSIHSSMFSVQLSWTSADETPSVEKPEVCCYILAKRVHTYMNIRVPFTSVITQPSWSHDGRLVDYQIFSYFRFSNPTSINFCDASRQTINKLVNELRL